MISKKKKHLVLIIVLSLIVAAGIIGIIRTHSCCPLAKNDSDESKINASQTDKVTALKLPRLLELGSKRCMPCKMMEPILDKIKKEYDGILKVDFIDVWLEENIAVGKKFKIDRIPVQLFFDAEGKELWRHMGYFPEDQILKKWKELGYDLPALKKMKMKK